MNFFQHQEAARKRTALLVVLLMAAVIALVGITIIAVAVVWYYVAQHSTSIQAANAWHTDFSTHFAQIVSSETIWWVAFGVIGVITMGSLYKLFQIGRGGKFVAESLGGILISRDTQHPDERKVLNVVEEMAIASGNSVPSVYLMEEPGINAFAAGISRRDTVIGVTRGTITHLDRDELQGVIAHEFSHIHNGDMKLNMRLIAILHGILLIGLIGYFILRGSGRGVRRDKGRGQVMIAGLVLIVIGYAGTFFGNLIKSAVSRQREFLADASAVQFTRNPQGISNALMKIGGLSYGSRLDHGTASQFSHMFFNECVSSFGGFLATHPPLDKRIRRIEPKWNGQFPVIGPKTAASVANTDEISKNLDENNSQAEKIASVLLAAGAASQSASTSSRASHHTIDESTLERVGEIDPEGVEIAKDFLTHLPEEISTAAHDTHSAKALIYCLLLDKDGDERKKQAQILKKSADPATLAEIKRLFKTVMKLPREQYLMLVELCIPSLKLLPADTYAVFKNNLKSLIQADGEVHLFEWCLFRIVTHSIETKRVSENKRLGSIVNSAVQILSLVIAAGKNTDPVKTFNEAKTVLGKGFENATYYEKTLSFEEIDLALNELSRLKPLAKPVYLKALIQVINADNEVHPAEAELFRAIAESLDCPVPPLAISS